MGSLGLATALIVTYFLAAPGGLGPIVSLKLMALNTWGMPATFGAQDKTSRMQAIGELIQKQEYDIYLLEELWMKRSELIGVRELAKAADVISSFT